MGDAGHDGNYNTSWRDLESSSKNTLKRKFKEEKLVEIIETLDDVNPQTVVNAIMKTTNLQRKGFEEGSRLQRDWEKMEETERNQLNQWVQETLKAPKGKFDHVTCLCLQVGKSSNRDHIL